LEIEASSASSLQFLRRGTLIAIGSDDARLRVYEVESGRLTVSYDLQGSVVRTIAENPSNGLIAVGTDDRRVRLYAGVFDEFLGELRGHRDRISAAIFHPNGEHLITVSDDYTAEAWRTVPVSQLQQPRDQRRVLADELSQLTTQDLRNRLVSADTPIGERRVLRQVLASRAVSAVSQQSAAP
ncbi:MAG: hypothetical protein AAFN41_13825, partial [Planctomycetota bacterium]